LKKILSLLLGNSGFLWEQEELQNSIKISSVNMYNGFLTLPFIIRLIYYGNLYSLIRTVSFMGKKVNYNSKR